ncbi:MAG TPA: hypothetical protein VN708_18635 [Terriglobales bacterium]|jgi:hypothetical protein|nr:hypothetical protein [Terriglobales bacterium]
MESARRGLQIVRLAMLISIALYFGMVRMIPSHASPNPLIFRVLAIFAFANLGALVWLRKLLVATPCEVLRSRPEDAAALGKWKSGQLITWALGESIALYGLILHFLGFSMGPVIPFFLTGALLILLFPPRLPDRVG